MQVSETHLGVGDGVNLLGRDLGLVQCAPDHADDVLAVVFGGLRGLEALAGRSDVGDARIRKDLAVAHQADAQLVGTALHAQD